MSYRPFFAIRPSLGEQVLGVVVMSRATGDATVVALLDWQGQVVWISSENPTRGPGYAVEDYVRKEDRGKVRDAFERVIKFRSNEQYQVVNEIGETFRVWLWPMDSPEVAVCALCIHVPDELARLTQREQDCLKLLAHGMPVEKIATRLDIANSTVHTHFRRARDKLGLSSFEALISYAARHSDTFSNSANEHS